MAAYGDYHLVSGAGWSAYWRIAAQKGSGLEIWWADFQKRRVMWRGSAPFAVVPYHRPVPVTTGVQEPPPPHFCYKDGLDTQGGGASFRALNHGATNSGQWWRDASQNAAQDTDAVVAKVEPADDFGSERLVIAAKFQCGWYQYVHRWELDSDGAIHPQVAMGGMLNPFAKDKAHLHNFYFRIDLDIDGQYPHDVCEVFTHESLDDPPTGPGDTWKLVTAQGKLLADATQAQKWRVRNTLSKNTAGQFKGYEIEVPQLAGRGEFSTGDVWVTVYRGDDVQQGEGVGVADGSDIELEKDYAVGPLDTVKGNDIVLWIVVRAHHEPRGSSEEAIHLPYHYEEFSIVPRSFFVDAGRQPRRGKPS